METFSTRIVSKAQAWKTKNFQSAAHFLLNLGITANIVSLFSLLCGLLAVYFLFANNLLFLIFIILHLLADAFDGVLARLTTESNFGKFLDHILSDGLVTIFPIIKIGFILHDIYAYLAAGLFSAALISYAFSQYQAPILFMRLYVVIGLFVVLLFPYDFVKILLYLSVAVAGGYSLARQLPWFLQRKRFNT